MVSALGSGFFLKSQVNVANIKKNKKTATLTCNLLASMVDSLTDIACRAKGTQ